MVACLSATLLSSQGELRAKSSESLIRIYVDSPVLHLAQAAVPAPRQPAREKVLLNDFSFREPEEDLLLQQDGVNRAEALAHYAEALTWEEMAEGERAIEEYMKVLEFDPSYAELAIRVAYEYVRRGEIPKGLEILKDAAKASPQEPLLLLNLASIYARNLKKADPAIRYAREALRVAPENPLVYQTLHEIYLMLGQTKQAERVLEQAAKLKSEDPEYWLRLGDLHARIYIKEDGKTSPVQLERVNAIYAKALASGADNPPVLSRVADYYIFSHQVDKAIPLYLNVLETRASSSLLSSVREKLARSFLLSGQRDEAIRVLEEMVRENPLKYESYEFLGQLHEENGDFDKALMSYEQSLLLSPGEPVNHLRVSDLQLRTGQPKKAANTLEEARKRFADIPLLTYSLAVAYTQSGNLDRALQTFEEALVEAGNSEDEVVNGHFYFNYGAAAEQAGQLDRAAVLFKKSIELDPVNAAPALNYLGYMWVDRGIRLKEARKLIEHALDLDPANPAYIDSYGWLLHQEGNYEAALRELLRAEKLLKEEDAVVLDHIGETYKKLGRLSEAAAYWKRALVLSPDNKALAAKVESSRREVSSNTVVP